MADQLREEYMVVVAAGVPDLPYRQTGTEAADPEKACGSGAADVQTLFVLLRSILLSFLSGSVGSCRSMCAQIK